MHGQLLTCGDASLGASFDPTGSPDERDVDRTLNAVTDGDVVLAGFPFIIEESLEPAVVAATDAEGAESPQAAFDIPGATPVSKAEFILALPRHYSAKGAAAEPKQQGMAVSEKYVYQVRAAANPRPKPVKADAVKLASTRTAKAARVAFVSSLPPEMSYAEAAAKADDAGIDMDMAQFYRLKNQATRRVPRGASSKPVPRGVSSNATSRKPVPSASSSKPVPRAPSPKPAPRAASNRPAPKAASSKPVPRASSSKPVRAPTPKPASTPAFEGLRVASDDEREQALIEAIRALGAARACALIDAIENFERMTE